MPAYKFRLKFEEYDEVSRDYEIKPAQNFYDLHQIIQQSIKFDGSKPASFILSNDQWIRGREIPSAPKNNKDGTAMIVMQDAVLNKFIADPHQKMYYIFDTWVFYLELIKIVMDVDKNATYPRCIKSTGDAPPQYKKVLIAANQAEAELEEDDIEDDIEPENDLATEETFDEEHGFESEEGESDADENEETDEADDNNAFYEAD
ncbi:MAG: hypothetical protein JNK61_04315 [Bacteroidia bacterium]|nr:hypothetical protein [Bacteroidia bacterium]